MGKILFVIVGGIIAFVSGYGLELLRSKRNDRKIRDAILAEVKANVEYGKKQEPFWMDSVYKKNLDKITAFGLEKLKKIVRFYGMIEQYRYSENWGNKERQRLQQENFWSTHTDSLTDSAKKIRELGEEILNDC